MAKFAKYSKTVQKEVRGYTMVVLPKPELRTKEKRCRTTEIRVIPV